ncbi:MAG TPA: zf-TFIIB domain-containing protein [Chthoniobacteraceae bacterium]|nr:zf-TFIIB domain-containing protein [Chthoniobacteraceae bacterium]
MDAGTLNCPMCGAPAASDAAQCTHCGARLATVACPSCFGMIFEGSKFCPHCGAKVDRKEESDPKPRSCPRCHITLTAVALGATKVHECPKCEGLWIDTATYNEICADRDKQAAMLGDLPAIPPDAPLNFHLEEPFYIPCPVCGTLMNRVNFAHCSGIILEICKEDGVWFDHDQLRRVVEFIRAGGLEKSRERDLAQWEAEKRNHEARAYESLVNSPLLDATQTPVLSNLANARAASDFLSLVVRGVWHLLK